MSRTTRQESKMIKSILSLFRKQKKIRNMKQERIEELKKIVPKSYHWLFDKDLPRVLEEALHLYGIYEWRGADNNPVILEWAKEMGRKVGIDYTADSIPWCGLYVGICVSRAGFVPPDILVRAKQWADWGNTVKTHDAALGDVLVFDRRGGGHVGFYVGEDAEAYHVLGGNQSDQVNIRRLSKSRLIAVRRCPWKRSQPKSVKPVALAKIGIVSTNEA